MNLAADLRMLDEIAAAATPSSIEADVAGWWCKAAPDRPFRRCNVVLPPVDAAADRDAFAHALGEVRDWCHAHGRRLIVQVSTALPGHQVVDDWLAAEGLTVEAPVHVLVADRADTTEAREPGAVAVTRGVDVGWARAYGRIPGGDATGRARTEAYGRMLAPLGNAALGASRPLDGEVAGVGFGVIDRGWLGIFGMVTAPAHRRRGIATEVVGGLRGMAQQQGTMRAYLQVETDNDVALRLYDRLGFVRSHGYHYRSEGADPTLGC